MVKLISRWMVTDSPEILGFTRNNVWGQRWCMLYHQERDRAKSHCLDAFISLHGWCKAFVMENGSIDAFDRSRYYQPMHKESIDAIYQVVEASFGQILLRHNIKKSPLTVRTTKNICAGKWYHTKTATTQIRQMELFCALLIPHFYITDFETKMMSR